MTKSTSRAMTTPITDAIETGSENRNDVLDTKVDQITVILLPLTLSSTAYRSVPWAFSTCRKYLRESAGLTFLTTKRAI